MLDPGNYKAYFLDAFFNAYASTSFKIDIDLKPNIPPRVEGQSVSVVEDRSVSITLKGSDEDGDNLEFTVVSQPNNGTLSGTAPNLTYSPLANFNGNDSFTYKANDGEADSNTATVTIEVLKKLPGVNVSKSKYSLGEPIEISFDNGPGNAKDWIGIFKEGGPPNSDNLIEWSYLDGTKSGNNGKVQGAVSLDGDLSVGNYQVLLLENDRYDVIASASFSVTLNQKKVYFEENFDKLSLGPLNSFANKGDGTDWTAQGPEGWEMRKNVGHGEGLPDANIVEEFDGWTFFDPNSWNEIAGERRSEFTNSFGVMAVVDSDQFYRNSRSKINASLLTPPIDITGAEANSIVLKYDYSWRNQVQTGSVSVSYDGGPEIELLKIDPAFAHVDGLNESLELNLKNPEGAKSVVVSWNYQGSNTWWWAIDNIILEEKGDFRNEEPKEWTILVYGNADHNLTDSLLFDMMEMERVGSGKDLNIVVQADFNPKCWDPNDRDASKFLIDQMQYISEETRNSVSRWLIGNDYDLRRLTLNSRPVEFIPEINNMDDPDTLTDFINWASEKFPAKRYGLVLWDHGGQWEGFGGDRQNGTKWDFGWTREGYMMSTNGVRKGILNSNINKFDFLSFDTCLMAGVEILADIHDLADVYMACAEIDMGRGWHYTTLRHLKNDPQISTIEFGKREVEDWDKHHSYSSADINLKNHAAFDMRMYDSFNSSFVLFSDLISNYDGDRNVINRTRLDAIHYRIGEVSDIKNPTKYIDLGHFALTLAESLEDGPLKSASLKLASSIDAMVINHVAGSRRQESKGLSIYYPGNGVMPPDYWELNFTSSDKYGGPDWRSFLKDVYFSKEEDTTPPYFWLTQARNDTSENNRGRSLDQIDGENITATKDNPIKIEFTVNDSPDAYEAFAALVTNEETDNPNQYIYMGEIDNMKLDGSGEYDISWNGTLPVLSVIGADSEAEGEIPVYLGGWYLDSDSETMVSFFDYQANENTEKISLIIITELDENGKGVIDSILYDTGDEELSPTIFDEELQAGGKLWPVYYTEELMDNGEWDVYYSYFEDYYIRVPERGLDGLTISSELVEPGYYGVELQTFDLLGNGSEIIEIEIEIEDESGVESEVLPELNISRENNMIVLDWPINDVDNLATLQRADKSEGEWMWLDVPEDNITFDGDVRIFTENMTNKVGFYRLIRK